MNYKPLKVMTIVGTRPEIIRLSRVMPLLDQYVNHVIVHTGQNYDYELNEIFWEELELRRPDHFLAIDTISLGSAVGDMIKKSEEVLLKDKPDALLILGDTNSCLSAYMAKRMHIPVFHMEAGNRCFDENVPEETNRRIIDHIADYNMVYTEHARRHLLSEGLPHNKIFLTGSPLKEVLDYYETKIEASKILDELKLKPKEYFLVSTHREENVDNPQVLQRILLILNRIADTYNLPVIVSTHPRAKKRIEALIDYEPNPLLRFMKPFGYLDYIKLQQQAKCVISDSGTISEESAILSFPAITIRTSMERPEAMDAGTIILTGFDVNTVVEAIDMAVNDDTSINHINTKMIAEYIVNNFSLRVLKVIVGHTKLHQT